MLSRLQRASRNGLNINQIQTSEFWKFQYGVESRSGPVGRRSDSSLSDQCFQARKAHFWCCVDSLVVDFVDEKST